MGMACLSCHSMTKTPLVFAFLPTNTNSPSPPSNTDPKPLPVPVPTTTASTRTKSTTTLPYRDYEKPMYVPFSTVLDHEKKRKKSGFMEEGTAGRSSERLESGLPPKLMEDFAPMMTFRRNSCACRLREGWIVVFRFNLFYLEFEPIGCPVFHRIQVNSEGTLPSEF
ncbi:hypothetical protein POTOM_031747 [Populus tomentosa]|uniref:Uncharacterized protein n=1 Tax=Populus tomentosa TaxID=118781 RepID=A0A8X8CSU9_POPTO|nr:hypothetical protein POTOM_031747 [Populus tomentosa]